MAREIVRPQSTGILSFDSSESQKSSDQTSFRQRQHLSIMLSMALIMALSACGSPTPQPTGSGANTDTSGGSGQTDAQLADIPIFQSDTSATPDAVAAGDTSGGASDDTTATDGGQPDASPKICETEGGFGCKCTENDDCDTGFCVQGPNGQICTKTCLGNCPSGFKCVQTGDSGDLTYLCAPTTTTLCQPCELDGDCDHVGADKGSASCLPMPGADGSTVGSFCSAPCGGGVACPSGYDCKELDLSSGKTSQCVPQAGTKCACNGWGIETKAKTTCSTHSDKGTCWGVRSCSETGLEACTAAIPAAEACNLADDDCDGDTDEGFSYDDGGVPKTLGKTCGQGACLGGTVTCSTDGLSATCSSENDGSKETCNFKDDNCDGQTDEGLSTTDSTCAQTGVCNSTNVKAACTKGQWACDFTGVAGYEAVTETTCDGKDNNCDGLTDEAFQYDAVSIGAPCDGVGACGKGFVVCAANKAGATCSTNPDGTGSEAKPEVCDDIDNDCDGVTDEGCDDDGDGYCDAGMTVDGAPAICTEIGLDCNDNAKAVNPGAKEICNDIDDDCNKTVDDGCDDDGDGVCDEAMVVVGKPAICPKGNGDCDDKNKNISPVAKEVCDAKGVDENCNNKSEEENANGCKKYYFDGDKDGYGKQGSAAKCLCKPDAAAKFTSLKMTDCDDGKKTVSPVAKESCATIYDDDCDKNTNDLNAIGCKKFYVDVDDDNFGATNKPTKCLCASIESEHYTATKGGDCADQNKSINPAKKESCTTKFDDNCNNNDNDINALYCTPFYKDVDGDGYGAAKSPAVCTCKPNTALKYTALKGLDCDDSEKNVKPGVKDTCSTAGVDDNCDGKTDQEDSLNCKKFYFDKDGDGYGIGAPRCLCGANKGLKFTAKSAGDCDDSQSSVKPGATELCNGKDDDCDKTKDEGATASCTSVSKATVACQTPSCKITKCSTAYYDIDKKYSNGCECAGDSNTGGKGSKCSSPIIGATLVDTEKKAALYSGNLMPGETGQWYRFYAKDGTDVGSCDNYSVRIRFVSNPGGIFQMDIYRGGCAGSQQLCKDETDHNYRVNFYGKTYGPGSKVGSVKGKHKPTPKPVLGGECKCTSGTGVPGYNICKNNSAYYYVRVHYKAGVAPVCTNFKIEFSNGVYK